MRLLIKLSVLLGMLVVLPLLGIILSGKTVGHYLEFPPLTRYVDHPPFQWNHFFALAIFVALCLAPFVVKIVMCLRERVEPEIRPEMRPFPWWGWVSLAGGAIFWVLAWNRFPWFAPFQRHTFTPLWLSYILTVNALTLKRSRRCMLLSDTGYFLFLFPASTLFWWFFEFLNRFVQNWYYVGAKGLSSFEYIFFASISFSTVLPAVLGTRDLLLTFPFFRRCFRRYLALKPANPKLIALIALLISSAGLSLIGLFPDFTYPLIWISPLLIIVSLQALFGERHILSEIGRGEWPLVISSCIAALICGFFWEMWNYHSLSKWVYSIPYVHKFMVFEMPLLGYAGYLPFGLQCSAAGDIVKSEMKKR